MSNVFSYKQLLVFGLLTTLFLGACAPKENESSSWTSGELSFPFRISNDTLYSPSGVGIQSTENASNITGLSEDFCYAVHIYEVSTLGENEASCANGTKRLGKVMGLFDLGDEINIQVPVGRNVRFDLVGILKSDLGLSLCKQEGRFQVLPDTATMVSGSQPRMKMLFGDTKLEQSASFDQDKISPKLVARGEHFINVGDNVVLMHTKYVEGTGALGINYACDADQSALAPDVFPYVREERDTATGQMKFYMELTATDTSGKFFVMQNCPSNATGATIKIGHYASGTYTQDETATVSCVSGQVYFPSLTIPSGIAGANRHIIELTFAGTGVADNERYRLYELDKDVNAYTYLAPPAATPTATPTIPANSFPSFAGFDGNELYVHNGIKPMPTTTMTPVSSEMHSFRISAGPINNLDETRKFALHETVVPTSVPLSMAPLGFTPGTAWQNVSDPLQGIVLKGVKLLFGRFDDDGAISALDYQFKFKAISSWAQTTAGSNTNLVHNTNDTGLRHVQFAIDDNIIFMTGLNSSGDPVYRLGSYSAATGTVTTLPDITLDTSLADAAPWSPTVLKMQHNGITKVFFGAITYENSNINITRFAYSYRCLDSLTNAACVAPAPGVRVQELTSALSDTKASFVPVDNEPYIVVMGINAGDSNNVHRIRFPISTATADFASGVVSTLIPADTPQLPTPVDLVSATVAWIGQRVFFLKTLRVSDSRSELVAGGTANGGSNAVIYRSADGGHSWYRTHYKGALASPTRYPAFTDAIQVGRRYRDSNTGQIRSDDYGFAFIEAYKTTDGGTTADSFRILIQRSHGY